MANTSDQLKTAREGMMGMTRRFVMKARARWLVAMIIALTSAAPAAAQSVAGGNRTVRIRTGIDLDPARGIQRRY